MTVYRLCHLRFRVVFPLRCHIAPIQIRDLPPTPCYQPPSVKAERSASEEPGRPAWIGNVGDSREQWTKFFAGQVLQDSPYAGIELTRHVTG